MSTFTTNKNMIHDDLCIATRIHSMPKNTTSFKNDLKTFIENGITYSNAILIAVKANIADFRDNHNENNNKGHHNERNKITIISLVGGRR